MRVNKKSFSENFKQCSSSTEKNSCGCIKKDSTKESGEEIDIKLSK